MFGLGFQCCTWTIIGLYCLVSLNNMHKVIKRLRMHHKMNTILSNISTLRLHHNIGIPEPTTICQYVNKQHMIFFSRKGRKDNRPKGGSHSWARVQCRHSLTMMCCGESRAAFTLPIKTSFRHQTVYSLHIRSQITCSCSGVGMACYFSSLFLAMFVQIFAWSTPIK